MDVGVPGKNLGDSDFQLAAGSDEGDAGVVLPHKSSPSPSAAVVGSVAVQTPTPPTAKVCAGDDGGRLDADLGLWRSRSLTLRSARARLVAVSWAASLVSCGQGSSLAAGRS